MSSRRAAVPILLVAGCIALAGCSFAEPAPAVTAGSSAAPTDDARLSGDARLLKLTAGSFRDPEDRVAVAVIDADGVRTAFIGADEATSFEIGSITKVFTGELLAMAIERGEVALTDTLGTYLDLGDAPAASVTLEQLATHASGLPYLPSDAAWAVQNDAAEAAGLEPVGTTLDELLALTRTESVAAGEWQYSTLGAALLGHALAAAAGTDYRSLLGDRILEPLGLDGAVLVETPDEVPATHAGGFTVRRTEVEPWSFGAFAPADGVHATLDDLVFFAQAVIDGPLSTSAALEPLSEEVFLDTRVGYLWIVTATRPRTMTWHDGGTGGFSSTLTIDRDAGTAAIVLSNNEYEVTELGERILRDLED